MRRIITLLAFATLAGALVFGAAAALTVTSSNLGSGSVDVSACDGNGVNVEYNLDTDPALVESITITDVAATCDQQALHAVVTDGTSAVIEALTGTVDESTSDGTETLTFSSPVAASEIEGVSITITG